MKEEFDADWLKFQKKVNIEREKRRKRSSIYTPLKKIGHLLLWSFSTVAAYYLILLILHLQWIPYNDLLHFFPVECILFQLCAFIYGADLYAVIIVGYRTLRGYELIKTEGGEGASACFFCISSIAIICNLWFLFFII